MIVKARRSVLVTGASTGIGRATAFGLMERGYRVYAGVRRDRDADALRSHGHELLIPVILDVTDESSVRAAHTWIVDDLPSGVLDGLVNNAGIAVGGPLECTPINDVRRQLEVNVLGVLTVFQSFAPLLRAARGRIVNVGSMAGMFSPAFQGPYCASKHALRALTDSMRRELKPFGVHVALLEPGSLDTNIVDKATSELRTRMEKLPDDARALYGRATERTVDALRRSAQWAPAPETLIPVIVHALESKLPRTRYVSGIDARLVKALTTSLPDRALDWLLNRIT
jgi:NAD(P)-dependent dehydrogenase (short-subunit alcohol dehydrogenase family)